VGRLDATSDEETDMSERDAYPHGVPCWVDTLQADPDAALEFYGGVFGWEFEGPGDMPGDPPGRYYVARLRGRDVAGIGSLPPGDQALPPSLSMYVRVDSADDAAAEALAAGGTVLVEPFDVPPAGRMAVVADSTGAPVCLWEAGAREGAQVVNEAGAWAMSQLRTPDPKKAAAFYSAVFGWTTESFGSFTLFRLPGYVGGEPEQPVSREVIAAMASAEPGEAPRWSADFWVDDVDAAVASAERLGGRTIMPPFPSPAGKSAVLADPSGVSFGVSSVPGTPPAA
jgi:predicted enzyme related to lactoylglutathione lyase